MKLPCKVVEDLLPMYYDKVCSEESAALIEEHMKDCPRCSRVLLDLRSDIDIPEKKVDDIKPLKKIQKSYKKMRLGWLIAILCVLVLIPIAFLIGNLQGGQSGYAVEYSEKEALACGNAFMTCLAEGDYAKAYAYWDIEEERYQLLSGTRFKKEDLVNLEADGLKKFCEGGAQLEALGGIGAFEFVEISGPYYTTRDGSEKYFISYSFQFQGKEEGFGLSVGKNGITDMSGGDGLLKHPLTHLTLWVQWLVDDYAGQYYDRDLGQWVDIDRAS